MVSEIPVMDPDGLQFFKANISKSICYLEYGSGGSTVYSANIAKVKNIISVDSDPKWIDAVKNATNNAESNVYFNYCNIGDVGEWGNPKNKEQIDNFWKYSFLPWDIAKKHSLDPDLVLVDGRFRVASFLVSILFSSNDTLILFDDYYDRPHYWVVEEHCNILAKHGRMAIFRSNKNFSSNDIVKDIAKFSIISN